MCVIFLVMISTCSVYIKMETWCALTTCIRENHCVNKVITLNSFINIIIPQVWFSGKIFTVFILTF